MTTAREAAVRVLTALERGHTTLSAAVDRERRTLADPRDRALLLEMVSGTMRWRNALDFALADASRRPLAELAAPVRATLRLGAFQLRHLDRVPDHAVVNEAVELTRRTGHRNAAGFVNAVLRTMVRRAGSLRLPPRPGPDGARDAQLTYLSITLSHPAWLAARWLDRFGFENTEAWCRFNNDPPEISMRALAPHELDLPAEAERAGVGLRPARHVAGAWVAEAGALGHLPEEVRRRTVVQDEGSQLVALTAPVDRGSRVLDLCAAPGNKTTLLAARTGSGGSVVACDLRPARIAVLRRTLAASGVPGLVVRLDANTASAVRRRLRRCPPRRPLLRPGNAQARPGPEVDADRRRPAGARRAPAPHAPRGGLGGETRRPHRLRDMLERARRERRGHRALPRQPPRLRSGPPVTGCPGTRTGRARRREGFPEAPAVPAPPRCVLRRRFGAAPSRVVHFFRLNAFR